MNPPGPYVQLIIFILWIFWIILINTNWFLVRKDFISIQLYSSLKTSYIPLHKNISRILIRNLTIDFGNDPVHLGDKQ